MSTDITTLVDQMWTELMLTTISGHKYDLNGQPASGRWGNAKALRDQIKAAAAPPPPTPPVVSVTAPTEGQALGGKATVSGTASDS